MTDRELLEAAAKAAGIEIKPHPNNKISPHLIFASGGGNWNPIIDDGDALRLAVKLRLVVHVWDDSEQVSAAKTLPDGEDPAPTDHDAWHLATAHSSGGIEAATRRAIVRAAAALPNGGSTR